MTTFSILKIPAAGDPLNPDETRTKTEAWEKMSFPAEVCGAALNVCVGDFLEHGRLSCPAFGLTSIFILNYWVMGKRQCVLIEFYKTLWQVTPQTL